METRKPKNWLPVEEHVKRLAKRPVGVGLLCMNEFGEILLLKHTYKTTWGVPGGSLEENESPIEGVCRELFEELGIDFLPHDLLCISSVKMLPPVNILGLHFMFRGPIITQELLSRIRLQEDEIVEFQFVSFDDIKNLVSETSYKIINSAHKVAMEDMPIEYIEM